MKKILKNLICTYSLIAISGIAQAVEPAKPLPKLPSVEESRKKSDQNITSIQKSLEEAQKHLSIVEENYIKAKALNSLDARRKICIRKTDQDMKSESQFSSGTNKKELEKTRTKKWFECMELERDNADKAMASAANIVIIARSELYKTYLSLVDAIRQYNTIPGVQKKPTPAPPKVTKDEPAMPKQKGH